jgi:pimeloyl-ACP methyl ester carboxylesterase
MARLSRALGLGGCASPIGADFVTSRRAHEQTEANVLRSGALSATTLAFIHRYDLRTQAKQEPVEAVRILHRQVMETRERDLLFALAELSYFAGDQARRVSKHREPVDERDFYLGCALYAWLFLFGDSTDPRPGPFDRRFRTACDLYNLGLGQALMEGKGTNGVVRLEGGKRALPVGSLAMRFDSPGDSISPADFDVMLLADRFLVRGLSRRNRESGLGVPLVGVRPFDPGLMLRRCAPATALLRLPLTLEAFGSGECDGKLELYSAFEDEVVNVGSWPVPLERDLTVHMAYLLNQRTAWGLGKMHFRDPAGGAVNRLIPFDAFRRGRIPLVLVHGTFSSPVGWAEFVNSLIADPMVRRRYQIWSFMYGSGNPLLVSAAQLRESLAAAVQEIDPAGDDPALQQMVVVGHSQGGLLTKLTATNSDELLWQILHEEYLSGRVVDPAQHSELRRLSILEPLPFVRRVVFIGTPHRGSYLAKSFARRFATRMVSLPANILSLGRRSVPSEQGSGPDSFLGGRVPTSLDGMSPKNPLLLRLADIPVSSHVLSHSIISVKGDGDFREGRDGVVEYESAHVPYVESELVVRGPHSCQAMPATIEEVRRILHQHLDSWDSPIGPPDNRLP